MFREGIGQLDRSTFNSRAAELDLPLFGRNDANGNGSVDRRFSKAFVSGYRPMVEVSRSGLQPRRCLQVLYPGEPKGPKFDITTTTAPGAGVG